MALDRLGCRMLVAMSRLAACARVATTLTADVLFRSTTTDMEGRRRSSIRRRGVPVTSLEALPLTACPLPMTICDYFMKHA